MFWFGLSWFALLLGPMTTAAPDSHGSISEALLRTHVQYLASDELGGRGVGTEGIDQAAEYIARAFADCGLKAGGDEGSYFQEFEIPGTISTSELAVLDQPIQAISGRDYSVLRTQAEETSFEGPVVFAGYGVIDPQRHHDDYAGLDVTGKVVLMFRREPPSWSELQDSSPPQSSISRKAELAQERGAVAVLLVNPPRGDDDELTFRSSESFPLPVIHITRKLSELVLRSGGFPELGTLHEWLADGKRVIGLLRDVQVRGRVACTVKPFKTRNVVGILPGEGARAGEYLAFGAHYDHLGTVPARRRPMVGHSGGNLDDEIHNGADDNASGTAGVIELARGFASGPRPPRSLIFMAFSGEEVGLNGSRHFVDHPTIPLDRIIAMFNMDMIGRLESDPLEVFGTQTAAEFENIINRHASDLGLELRLNGGGTGPSDHTSFFNKEIPVLFFFTGLHGDYHKPTDDAELVDYLGICRVLRFVQAVAHDVIALEPRPSFRAVSASAVAHVPLKVRMGIMPSYGDPVASGEGWPIDGVSPDGPAARAGIRKGDRILTINDIPIRGIEDYMNSLRDHQPGDEADLTILRDGQKLTLAVVLQGK